MIVGKRGRAILQDKMNLAVVNLVCMACIPPTIVDYPQWKTMQITLNSHYVPISSTQLVDSLIPGQAAHVRAKTMEYLKTQYHLTVSYDGATIAKPQGVYTVSFTTPDGCSFLIEGSEASDESHTGEHISGVVLRAMARLGYEHFSGIASDNTGNTRVARRLTCEVIKTLINMPDVCHHTNLAIKDICRLPVFEDVRSIYTFAFSCEFNIMFSHQVIKNLRLVVSFFSHSTFSTTHLTRIRKRLKISRGIEKIGKTRFGTICLSSMAVDRCAPAIKVLTENEATRLVCPNRVMAPSQCQSTNCTIPAR